MNSLEDKTFKDYLSDVGLYGVVHLLLPLTGLITLSLITKVLGVADYGIYSLATTTIGMLIFLVHLMLPSALIRFLAGENNSKVISSTFISALLIILLAELVVLSVMVSLSGILASTIFHDTNARVYLYIIAVILVFEGSSLTLYSYFRVLEQVKRFLKYEVLFNLTRIGLIAAAVFALGDVLYILLAMLLNSMATAGLLLTILLREQGWARPDLARIKPYLVFCLPLIVPQIMAWVISLSDRYFLSYFWGATEVGIYSASYDVSRIIGGLNDAIWFVLLPVIFRLWNKGQVEEVRKYFTQALKLFVLFGIPASCGLIMLANPVLTALSTAEVGQQSWQVVPFVCLSLIAYAVYGYGADIHLIQRKTRPVAYFTITAAAVNIAGNFLLIPQYGLLGAAIATLSAYIVMAVIAMGTARRYLTFPVEWFFIGKVVLASAVMSVFLWFFQPTQIWQVVLSIFLGAAIYFLVLFLIKGFSRQEIELSRRFLTGKRS